MKMVSRFRSVFDFTSEGNASLIGVHRLGRDARPAGGDKMPSRILHLQFFISESILINCQRECAFLLFGSKTVRAKAIKMIIFRWTLADIFSQLFA